MYAMGTARETVIQEFIDQMGLVAEGEGLSRIAGRIMALLVVEGGPLSFADLAQRLEVSRGSVSTNTRLLERLGVIERVALRGDRQDYFRLATAPYERMLDGLAQRAAKAHSVVARAKAGLPASDRAAQRRLAELGAFYEALGGSFRKLSKRFSSPEQRKPRR